MVLFLAHTIILLGVAHATARRLLPAGAERILATALLAWGNLVATCLLLSGLHRLGEPAWFLGTSIALALAAWLALRRVRPEEAAGPEAKEGRPGRLLLAAFILTLLPLGWASLRIAATYEPNNFDSLTYHLPRSMYYLGQNSLAHFDTGNPRQTYFPFNYNLLQLAGLIYRPPLQCVTFLNLAMWGLAGLAVWRLCRRCACGANAALIATWLAITSTQVLAQATATTNDLPVGTGLLCTLVFALRWRQSRQTRDALLAGLAAGLTAGTKLTVIFFAPAAGLIILALAWQHWRRGEIRAFFSGVKAWLLPALLVFALASPFALINLAGKGRWINQTYDYTLNRPFSLACAAQTSRAYLTQLFIEPVQRFTFDLKLTERLNEWGQRTLFPNWNPEHAFHSFYLFPPDMTEDQVWFAFTGPFIVLCGVFCLLRFRPRPAPVLWLAALGLGWFAAYFLLNKWSLFNQRYFIPAILVLVPCVAAMIEAAATSTRRQRGLGLLIVGLALCAFWQAGVYLLQNTRRPYAPLWAGRPPPPALPPVPPLLTQRLSAQPHINIHSVEGNERIFPLMAAARHRRFTSWARTVPEAYNVFSEWGVARKVAYRNLGQLSSYTTVEIPTKRSAGVEFLGSTGISTETQDYYGLPPHANTTPSTEHNRKVLVVISYAPHEPDRYIHTRVKIVGLNPSDRARLAVGVEYEDGTAQTLATFRSDGDVPTSIPKPFRRLTVRVADQDGGQEIGAINIPVLVRDKPPEYGTPHDPAVIFEDELVANGPLTYLTTEGLAITEGPYPQWGLPLVRWANAPVGRVEIPADDSLVRLRLSFSLRLHVREHAAVYLFHNGRPVKSYQLDDAFTWLDDSLDLTPAPGRNVLEFRNVSLNAEIDWRDYLERYPDVKDFLVSRQIPLEQGARDHYRDFGKKEQRPVTLLLNPEPVAAPKSFYFLFRRLKVEGFRNP